MAGKNRRAEARMPIKKNPGSPKPKRPKPVRMDRNAKKKAEQKCKRN